MATEPTMPLGFLGERVQLAFVVRDMDATLTYWTQTLRIGPFVVIETARGGRDFFYRGKLTQADFALSFAYMGDVQVEIIQPLDNHPSIYKDFLDSGREGLHHLGYWPDDFEGSCARLEANGFAECSSVRMPDGTRNAAYYDAPGAVGTMIEIVPLTKDRLAYFGRIQRLSQTWDGVSRPIRRFRDRPAFLASGEGADH